MGKVIAILCACALLTGCASTKPTKPAVIDWGPAPVLTGTVQRAAVHIGVLSTLRGPYGTKPLLCPGADVDLQIGQGWSLARSIPHDPLLSTQARRTAVIAAIEAAVATFDGPEDLLIITLSGHGGRVRDLNGDEPSGWDSTWCLADGPWLDDDVWTAICKLPPCRILFVADTCHAEGSFRRFVPFWETAIPADMDARGGQWGGTIVQFAACREAESAFGNPTGGQWHIAMDEALPGAATYESWFKDGAAMVEDQTPTLATYGHPEAVAWFLRQKPLE